MRRHVWRSAVLTTVLAMPLAASAQQTTTTDTTTTADSAKPATSTGDTSQQSTTTTQTTTTTIQQTTHNGFSGSPRSEWIASGFVGSDFGNDSDGNSVNFGGSIGYLWNSWVGAEFLAGFAPDFRLSNTHALLFGSERPEVNSYMVNVMGAAPAGIEGHVQPFASAGVGAITLGSNQLNNLTGDTNNAVTNTVQPDDTRFGGNIGGGVMVFGGNWGVRGDVRYFRAFSDNNITSTGNAQQDALNTVLPGLNFWRANIGLALRW
jgi:hypothetical protein